MSPHNVVQALPSSQSERRDGRRQDEGLGVTKEEALNRLRTIEGHIRGVARMVEEQAYCIDILHQTIAIQRAIDKLNQDVLEGHLQTCVTKAVQGQNDQDRERVIRELLDVFAASGKR